MRLPAGEEFAANDLYLRRTEESSRALPTQTAPAEPGSQSPSPKPRAKTRARAPTDGPRYMRPAPRM